MKEIHKQYDVDGLMQNVNTMKIYPIPMLVNVTRDKRGCTVSIGIEATGLQLTVPFDKVLKDLERENKWKPFDSTIPLEDGDYLVTYEDPQTHKLEVLIARYHMAENEDDECRFYDDTEVEITLAVKAWQSLPELYREEP